MSEINPKKIILHFDRKPAKQGNYYIFSIPTQYIKDGHIDVDKTYRIYVEELPEKTDEPAKK